MQTQSMFDSSSYCFLLYSCCITYLCCCIIITYICQALAAELGISESTIKKYENGERALSITNLFKIIDYFKVDANTILNVAESKKETSIDSRLELMDCSKKAYFQKIFNEMLDNAEMLVS